MDTDNRVYLIYRALTESDFIGLCNNLWDSPAPTLCVTGLGRRREALIGEVYF